VLYKANYLVEEVEEVKEVEEVEVVEEAWYLL
jgi:hypothetical protein